ANSFTGADHGSCTCELLRRKQTERVTHDYRYTCAVIRHCRDEAAIKSYKRNQPEIGLCLSAASRKPEQVHDLAVRMRTLSRAFECEQDKAELKGPPTQGTLT